MNNPELVATILKHGGRLLLVGGDMESLPRPLLEHPQILVWDDTRQNLLNKEIPSNVKVIIYNRWVSHSLVAKLNVAAKQLRAVKFPMQKQREIRELLAHIAQAEPQPVSPIDVEVEIEKVNKTAEPAFPEYHEEPEVEETTNMAKTQSKSPLKDFIAKHMNINLDYSVKGVKITEARRLFEIAEKEGLKTTQGSISQGIYVMVRELKGKKPVRKASTTRESSREKQQSVGDDFEELGRLISDAIVAMKLVQEHLPKVRKETEKLRGMKNKFLKLLE